MFELDKVALEALGAEITTREIKQQPAIWRETYQLYRERQEEIQGFIGQLLARYGRLEVIFTGAGSSAYVGQAITPYLRQVNDVSVLNFRHEPTTTIVSNPEVVFQADVPTLLVSFARSGNSPESVAAVQLGQALVKDFYQLTITCAPEGHLAKAAEGDDHNLVLLQPSRSNDAGFAMTGSFSCMMLTALLVFDPADEADKASYVEQMGAMAMTVFQREAVLKTLIDKNPQRVIYLGSGGFEGIGRETQLKILELTAGQLATVYDSSMGFRHGPKSFVDAQSLALVFVSNQPYTRQYDEDILAELAGDQIAQSVVAVQVGDQAAHGAQVFGFDANYRVLPDAYLAFPYLVVGQVLALLASIHVHNKPDTPSPTGTVNRVVKGVTIHDYPHA